MEKYIRQRYKEFLSNEYFTFHVPADSRITKIDVSSIRSGAGIRNAYRHMMFRRNELLMFNYPKFLMALQDFVMNRGIYYEHIQHQNADFFLTKPLNFYSMTCHIQEILELLSHYFSFNIDRIDFREVRSRYRDAYESFQAYDEEEVLEMEITELHQRIMLNIYNAISPVKELITLVEGEYWEQVNEQVFREAQNMSIEEFQSMCSWARYIKT